ncbi:MAG: hypothetical protein OSB62_07960 [Alphaproteobacteria bacterium]|nr:hypothetical protein [Alphaproteobacteria bacterium]
MNTLTVAEFYKKYAHSKMGSIKNIANRWNVEKEVDNFLSYSVAGGITTFDLLHGDGLTDQISPELLYGFSELMKDKANSYNEVREILTAKLMLGDESIFGLVNKIKGQIGENYFVEAANSAGFNARLADSGSQEAWDVAVDHANDHTQYIQVKTYSNAEAVQEHITIVNQKLLNGEIFDGSAAVTHVDFAVPQNIAPQVQSWANAQGINNQIIPFNLSAEDAGNIVLDGFSNMEYSGLASLFNSLAGATLTAAVLHTLVETFLVYKGAKESQFLLQNITEETACTSGGILAGMSIELLLQKLSLAGGVSSFGLIFITSITTRSILKRVVSRHDHVSSLHESNSNLEQKIHAF